MRFLILFLVVALTACGTMQDYKAASDGHWRHGYSEQKLSNNQYRVNFTHPNSKVAYNGFMRRSAEITEQNHHKYFSVKDVGPSQESGQLKAGYIDANMAQYEATITFEDKATKDNFEAAKILSNVLAQN